MDDITAAKVLIRCLDLTSLNDNDTEYSIEELCEKARTPYGDVAAVCIYPKFISVVKNLLKGSNIKVATIVNFPEGGDNLEQLKNEIRNAISLGADEIDAVFPYKRFLEKDYDFCNLFLKTSKESCGKKCLKIILETGEIVKISLIAKASEMCIAHGVNFIKTSTGKSKISATPEAANIILETLKSAPKTNVGLKVSGGIKTINDAKKYLVLTNAIMGSKWISQEHLRIGASSLLTNLLDIIKRGY